jgi:preprotein translocase subunit SecA
MLPFFSRLFDTNDKQINKLQPLVSKINALEPEFEALKDQDLAAKTAELKQRYADGASLDDLLPEAFANVREAAKRTIGQRHFDVQLVGGMVLHSGKIAEMKTGEGKTLVATLPLYLNALAGKGAHLVTVNGFLAQLGTGWNGPIYHMLGMQVAAIDHDLSCVYDPDYTNSKHDDERLRHLRPVTRRQAYQADITYATNNELGFDYLRDNMVQSLDQMSQRALHFAIVDEVDSILIDEARTPLIISAPAEESNELYVRFAKLTRQLGEADYTVDEKSRSASLTESGADKMDKWLGVKNIYEDMTLTHHLDQALRAQFCYLFDKDYVVRDGEVVIVDEFTGRLMPGRRYSEGLHQAIEAKEGVEIQKESKTLATITFQNYFRLYDKLSGMTGTAETEAEEFAKIYKLEVVVIPTNRPMIRADRSDLVYKTQQAKYMAVVNQIIELHKAGQPVLVGTTSVAKNEYLSGLLTKQRVPHEVLNAKNNEREAEIVAMAGQKGAITIATNLAGRGTDIRLGEGVSELGGLHVIGTERHESRRIDNQLRGRSGRQGDPGSSQFYVALDDDLMRLFGGDKIAGLMEKFNLPEDVPIENSLISRSIESAQVKVEGHNFDIRKHVVEYDDVINRQREIIYARRRSILDSLDRLKRAVEGQVNDENQLPDDVVFNVEEYIERVMAESALSIVASHTQESGIDGQGIVAELQAILPEGSVIDWPDTDDAGVAQDRVTELLQQALSARRQQLGENHFALVAHLLTLSVIDRLWMDHIDVIDDLRTGIGLQAYGQRDPLVEFKNQAFKLFERLMGDMDYETIHQLFKVELVQPPVMPTVQEVKQELQTGSVTATLQADALTPQSEIGPEEHLTQAEVSAATPPAAVMVNGRTHAQPVIDKSKLGRNDLCWCGSGKKYKNCHWPN